MPVLLSLLLSLIPVSYGHSGLSPERPAHVDYKEIASQATAQGLINGFKGFPPFSPTPATTYQARRNMELVSKTEWESLPDFDSSELHDVFQIIRNEKSLIDKSGRLRRLPWYFPDSGCFARAEAMTNRISQLKGRAPYKIFAFGNLKALTQFHPKGMIYWWYHVAPVVRSGNEIFVIDPGLDPSTPLRLQEWLQLLHTTNPEISICAPHSYDPNSSCTHKVDDQGARAKEDLLGFLNLELQRILELGLSPDRYIWL
jgi:Glutaminase